MTLSGPSIPIAMAEATDTRLLAIDELDLHLLAGHKFEAVADSHILGIILDTPSTRQTISSPTICC